MVQISIDTFIYSSFLNAPFLKMNTMWLNVIGQYNKRLCQCNLNTEFMPIFTASVNQL
jgi:hypothetical protein